MFRVHLNDQIDLDTGFCSLTEKNSYSNVEYSYCQSFAILDQINKANDYSNLMSSDFYLDQVKKCVTFIFEEKDKGVITHGTGFL